MPYRYLKTLTTGEHRILDVYKAMVAEGLIHEDGAQIKIAMALTDLMEATEFHESAKKRTALNIFGLLQGKQETPDCQGLYIYGEVGRGKSLLMDMFYQVVPVEGKIRIHFHNFMLDVHQRLHAMKNNSEGDYIEQVAKDIAEAHWLICFDEFQVLDIADAMILGRLFERLFDLGVVVVATSNRHPDDLYKDGLQRERFLPFISLFKQKMTVMSLDGEVDYRTQHLQSLDSVFMSPLGEESDAFIENSFYEMTGGGSPLSCKLHVQGRDLVVAKSHGDVAWFTFGDLCERPLGAADYMEIAEQFKTVMIQDIPQLNPEMRNEAKRFVTLIDALYEHRTKLIATAEVPLKLLYKKGTGAFEFERTVSRLTEMQSAAYLAESHL